MKISQKPMSEASAVELRAYANTFLQLDVDAADSEAAVTAAILTAQGWVGDGTEMIFVMEAPEAAQPAGSPPPLVAGARETAPIGGAMAGSLGHDDPHVTIKINNDAGRGTMGTRDVAVGVNGRVWQLKRMTNAKIPYRVYLALLDAVEDQVEHDPTTNEEVHTDVQRVTFQVIGALPSDDEIAAWRAKVDAVELA